MPLPCTSSVHFQHSSVVSAIVQHTAATMQPQPMGIQPVTPSIVPPVPPPPPPPPPEPSAPPWSHTALEVTSWTTSAGNVQHHGAQRQPVHHQPVQYPCRDASASHCRTRPLNGQPHGAQNPRGHRTVRFCSCAWAYPFGQDCFGDRAWFSTDLTTHVTLPPPAGLLTSSSWRAPSDPAVKSLPTHFGSGDHCPPVNAQYCTRGGGGAKTAMAEPPKSTASPRGSSCSVDKGASPLTSPDQGDTRGVQTPDSPRTKLLNMPFFLPTVLCTRPQSPQPLTPSF